MSVTVGQILDLLQGIAPVELAEEWDNVGLLVGKRDAKVSHVLCALDMTQDVLEEAIRLGAEMIVTHHPMMFRARKNLCEDDAEGRLLCGMVRAGVSLAGMHTNFDNAHPGVNDALAHRLSLRDVWALEHGMRVGMIDETTLSEFAGYVEKTLGGSVRVYGDPGKKIRKVAVLGGAGDDFISTALSVGADVYVTGEISYHKGLSAVDDGLAMIEAGHAATENPAISMLANALQIAANDVQYKVRVLCSAKGLFL